MKFSALEPLTDMGHTIESTYGRLCSEAFYDAVLEKICDLPNPNGTGDSAPMEFSFLVDGELTEDIVDLSISRVAAFPELRQIFRYLDISDESDNRYACIWPLRPKQHSAQKGARSRSLS
jgi:hypothetical protein